MLVQFREGVALDVNEAPAQPCLTEVANSKVVGRAIAQLEDVRRTTSAATTCKGFVTVATRAKKDASTISIINKPMAILLHKGVWNISTKMTMRYQPGMD
jgi:hypothetical protein